MIKHEDREIYKGITLKQYRGIFDKIEEILQKNNFDTVIEIGTCPGGLSMFLCDIKEEYNFNFYTFDIRKPNGKIINYLTKNGSYFYNESALNNELIKQLILSDKKVLILNDGIKVDFFKEYINLIKKDDVMMIHDYDTEWKLDDLKPEIERSNVIYNENLKKYLWLIIVKQEEGNK